MLKLFVGCVGVGKSTLINTLNGDRETLARVSNNLFEDGTTDWSKHGQFIDTPGLDSKNVSWQTLHDKIEQYGTNFQIFLLLDSNMGRASTFVNHFDHLLNEFVNPKFYIIWLRGEGSREKQDQWAAKYGGKLVEFLRPEVASIQNATVSVSLKPKHLGPFPRGADLMVHREATIPTSQPPQINCAMVSIFKGLVTAITKTSQLPISTDCLRSQQGILQISSLVKRVVATNDPEVAQMRLIGDCTLKLIVLVLVLNGKKVTDGLHEFIQPLIMNEQGFVPKFFNKYLKQFVGNDAMNAHSRGDCVEAILGYSLFGSKKIKLQLNGIPQLMIAEIVNEYNLLLPRNDPR